ncbi:hypothetical protein D3C81_1478370 [compost metagenome]
MLRAFFDHNGKRGIQYIRQILRCRSPSRIRGYHNGIHNIFLADVIADQIQSRQMIHRNVEETLDGGRMEIDGNDSVGSCRSQYIRHHFGRNRLPRCCLAFLSGVTIVRNNQVDCPCRSTFGSIHHNQKLDKVFVDGPGKGLDQEHIAVADRFLVQAIMLPAFEAGQLDPSERTTQLSADLRRQLRIRRTGENFHVFGNHGYPPELFCRCGMNLPGETALLLYILENAFVSLKNERFPMASHHTTAS